LKFICFEKSGKKEKEKRGEGREGLPNGAERLQRNRVMIGLMK